MMILIGHDNEAQRRLVIQGHCLITHTEPQQVKCPRMRVFEQLEVMLEDRIG